MGLITTAAFILATQMPPEGDFNPDSSLLSAEAGNPSKDRLAEIWNHIDNRLINQSDLWFDLGEFPRCVALLQVQCAYSPDDYDVMTSLGWMLENIDRKEEAKSVYLDFGKRHPHEGDAMFALGFMYSNAKDYDNAIKVLEPTLSLNVSPNTYRTLAKAYERKKNYKDAIRVWELELKKYPDEDTAKNNINRVKAKMAKGGN